MDQFKINIQKSKNLGTIYQALKTNTTQALDLSDILRAEFVLAVSALDHYIHEIVEAGIKEIYLKKRVATPKFLNLSVPLGAFWLDKSVLTTHIWLLEEVHVKHSFKSFQRSETIADAIKLVSEVPLWEKVGALMGISAKDAKDTLDLISDRRNKIAHEADSDPTNPGGRWPIDSQQVDTSITFIEQVAECIYQSLN